jgi:selenocysteine-specific elongation factor
VAAAVDQPLVVRRYSPPDLVCGGRVVVPQARVRRKGETPRLVEAQDLEGALLEAVGEMPDGAPTEEVCRLLGKTPQALGETFERLSKAGNLRGFAGQWFAPEGFEEGVRRFLAALTALHEENPTQAYVPRERAVQRANLAWSGKPLDRIMATLASEGRLEVSGTGVKDPTFRVRLSPRQSDLLARVVEALEKEPVNTPPPHELARVLVVPPQAIEEILKLGVQAGEVVAIGEGVYYTPKQLGALKAKIREAAGGKPFPASAVRDALGTTRKYVIPLLEYMDTVRFTTRVGDNRMVNER